MIYGLLDPSNTMGFGRNEKRPANAGLFVVVCVVAYFTML